jgi:hypothetical protein
MWSLVIRHLGNSSAARPRSHAVLKHNASRSAVTAITARKQKEEYGLRGSP